MLTCIVPVYNEKNTVLQVLKDLESTFSGVQIIIVDNNSTDGSKEVIQEFIAGNHGNKFELHECAKQGKANAVLSVCKHIQSDTVILHDADGEYAVETLVDLADTYKEIYSEL
jgi:glycosyltransferase involved in cell wall biosynthesis